MIPTDKQTIINGFDIQLEITDQDETTGDYASSCFINTGDYGSSLEFAQAFGGIEGGNDDFLSLGQGTLDAIQQWADNNGY